MDSLAILQFLIYFILAFSATAYVVLDGFDIGVGCMHLLVKSDRERRLFLNAIGPVWDGNSVWIVVTAGVLLAGFPKTFAILLSGLYTPFMLLIFCFMFRAAAIEFRGKRPGEKWRKTWDYLYFMGTFILAIDLGLIIGNLIEGMPINDQGEILVDFTALFTPYIGLMILFVISIFVMHGSIYLLLKTEGEIHDKIRKWTKYTIGSFLIFWVLTTIVTLIMQPHMLHLIQQYPFLWVFPILTLLCIAAIPRALTRKENGYAFAFSSLSLLFLFLLFAIGTFPNLVISSIHPETNSLTIFNSSSSTTALLAMVIVAVAGIPFAIMYSIYLHKVFKGKIKLDHMSY